MIIAHTFYTDGMHELAKVFVESFCLHHVNHGIPLFIDAMGINRTQQDELRDRYPHAHISMIGYPMASWARRCDVPVEMLTKWKDQIERGYITEEARAWKLLTAGDYRVHRVRKLTKDLTGLSSDNVLVHFDIDTLFRKSIMGLPKLMSGYDVGLKLRPKIQPIKARITIDVMAIRPVKPALNWLNRWCDIIDEKHPRARPVGFGQSSCWEAYTEEESNGLRALTLPLSYGLPGRNKPDDIIWCGNVNKLRKEDCADVFRVELDRQRNEGVA